MVGGRLADPAYFGELREGGFAGGESAKHVEAPFVAERATDADGAGDEVLLGVPRLILRGVADDPRVFVLAEQEPGAGGDVGDEHDPAELRLGFVHVAARDRRDSRFRRHGLGERLLCARNLLQ